MKVPQDRDYPQAPMPMGSSDHPNIPGWYLSMKQQQVSPYNPKLCDINARLSPKGNAETLVSLGLGMQSEIKRFGDSVIIIAGFY